jgi:hypothetical protein
MLLATSLAVPDSQTVLLMAGGLGVVVGAALWAHRRGPR